MWFIRYFRRLPPLLRVASILGLLCFLAVLTLPGLAWMAHVGPMTPLQTVLKQESFRIQVIVGNLFILGLVCTVLIPSYSTRFREPDKAPYSFPSWQSQLRAIAIMATLPACAVVLALFIPPAASAFAIVFPISLIGVIVLIVWRFSQ